MINAPFSADPALDHDDPDEAMAARHSSMLAELADIAMQLARAAGRKALAQAERTGTETGAEGLGDATLAFTRIARCVRQTLALQARLAQADRARADAVSALPGWSPQAGDVGEDALAELRERLCRQLAAAGREDDEPDPSARADLGDREDLLADLHERLDDEDVFGRGGRIPKKGLAGEAIARLRRDLDRRSGAAGETRPAASADPDRWPFPAAADGEPAAPRPAPPGRAAMPP